MAVDGNLALRVDGTPVYKPPWEHLLATPTPAPAQVLLTEENTERAIALDSVTTMRDPFPVVTMHNFSADQRTRITLFALNVICCPAKTLQS